MQQFRRSFTFLFIAFLVCVRVVAASYLVRDGQPHARIVVSKNDQRPRMVGMAALELQYYLQKMTGARLPIVTQPEEGVVNVYVGRSEYTDKLGFDDKDLDHGAFRIVSGDNRLVLFGRDYDFSPPEPWARNRKDVPRVIKEWDKKVGNRTDGAWVYTLAGLYRARWNPRDYGKFMAERYGEDTRRIWDPRNLKPSNDYHGPGMGNGFWLLDQGGSLNAVYGFLRDLGFRWYMPGDLGEVIPDRDFVMLPDVDKTVRADYPLRCWLGARSGDWHGLLWKRRIGVDAHFEVLGYGGTHGLRNVLAREEQKQKHPEFYATIGGYKVRSLGTRDAGEPCFSSEALVDESVAYLKFRFNVYGEKTVQFSPPDGIRKCNCDQCGDQHISDLVFGFLNRVAKKLYKTNPDNLVLGAAYSTYKEPPKSIDKFSPNVAVTINNCGRPAFNDPVRWKEYWDMVHVWRSKLAPGHLMRVENNRYEVHSPVIFPVIHPHAMAKDLKALKGISLGERNEISIGRRTVLNAPGCSHLSLYVNARFYWDADQDVEALLDEYYRKFYGPAAVTMKTAFDFSEKNSINPRIPKTFEQRIRFTTLLHDARDQVPADSVYAKRITAILDEMVSLAKLQQDLKRRVKMGDPRKNNPVAVGRELPAPGKRNTYSLRGLKKGEEPDIRTTFTVGWDEEKRHLVFDIRCEDPGMKNLMVADTVWLGDSVAILLEPPNHSYYQLEINPDGRLFDADRFGRRLKTDWDSKAQVTTEKADDHWRVVVRIPVVSVAKGDEDPNHFVVGPKPSEENPWYFNVGRARVRGQNFDKEVYAFSPTGANYHVPEKFAKLVIK